MAFRLLSTVSVCPIEEVAPAIKRPMWFQLYVLRDRGFMRNALERAKQRVVRRWYSPWICQHRERVIVMRILG